MDAIWATDVWHSGFSLASVIASPRDAKAQWELHSVHTHSATRELKSL